MAKITDPGNAGQASEFNYRAWTKGTTVELCNVPWNNDYRDIVRFHSKDELNAYITENTATLWRIENMIYLKPGHPITLPIPFNVVDVSNYIRVSNPIQPVSWEAGDGNRYTDQQRDYYYFITHVEYVAPSSTRVHLQLDVWQTYGARITPGVGYVERGHVSIANDISFKDNGKAFLTVPEGLDIGSEYDIVDVHSRTLANQGEYDVIVWSTVDLMNSGGSLETNPRMLSAPGTDFHGMPNGASAYWFQSATTFKNWLLANQEKTWITQGIISVMVVPPISEYEPDANPQDGKILSKANTPKRKRTKIAINWRNKIDLGRYRNLKKFLTFPYCVLELTSSSGNPLVLKPEQWDNDGEVNEIPYYSLPSPRINFLPHRYNAVASSTIKAGHDGGEFLDMTTGIVDFPTFSVVNNGYISFMASNKHAMAYQHQSADWSQQKALQGNQLSFDQASSSIGLANQMTNIGINQANASTNVQNDVAGQRAIQSGANSIIGGALNGDFGTAVMGSANAAADYAISTNANNRNLAISNNAARQGTAAQTGNMGYVRDTNKAYADFASRGDYANQIAAINAKVQDAKLIQPTTSGQVGGDAMNLAMYKWGYDLKIKMVNEGARRSIGEFWLRYGYATNAFMKPPTDFLVMSKFTYWKFQEFYVASSFVPENFKQTIRGIFEKGVTVWRNPRDIGTVDVADNEPIPGRYYQ